MKRSAYVALITTVFVAAVLLFLLERSAHQHSGVMPVDDRIQYDKLYVDLAKAVLVGFGAALLGILIPAVFTSVEPLHLFRYLDERTFRYNHREGMGAGDRFDIAVRRIVGKRLTYDTLIGRGLLESRSVV
jgi:hypothetical protein